MGTFKKPTPPPKINSAVPVHTSKPAAISKPVNVLHVAFALGGLVVFILAVVGLGRHLPSVGGSKFADSVVRAAVDAHKVTNTTASEGRKVEIVGKWIPYVATQTCYPLGTAKQDYCNRSGVPRVAGVLKNISGQELSYVAVRFALTNRAGQRVATTSDSTTNLRSGEEWLFKAPIIPDDAYDADFIEIEAR